MVSRQEKVRNSDVICDLDFEEKKGMEGGFQERLKKSNDLFPGKHKLDPP